MRARARHAHQLIHLPFCASQFLVDFISVVPFWLLTVNLSDPFPPASRDLITDTSTSTLAKSTHLVRVVKLLRMVKLARVLKASRVMQRALLDTVMNQWEWTFAVLKIMKLIVILCIYAHWQACIWGLLSSYMQSSDYPNWIQTFQDEFLRTHGEHATPLDVYVAALYWSTMTLTSIGYGAMTPVNTAERVLCSVYMMLSGMMWTYAIGSVAAIATTLDPNTIQFENTMDSLNYFMRERELPRTMRMTLRDYFSSARRVHQLNDDGELLDKMSPLLQGTVALAANKRWLDVVWYFRDIGNMTNCSWTSDFIAAIAKRLTIRSYVGHERMPIGQLYIVKRGLVVKMWRFLGSGKMWGEDLILDNPDLVDHAQAVALTYVECYTLRRPELDECLTEFPEAGVIVRKASRKILLQRAMLKHLVNMSGHEPKSFVPANAASGFTALPDALSLDQKLDSIHTLLSGSARPAPAPLPLGDSGGGDAPLMAAVREQQGEITLLKRDVAEIKDMMQQLLNK